MVDRLWRFNPGCSATPCCSTSSVLCTGGCDLDTTKTYHVSGTDGTSIDLAYLTNSPYKGPGPNYGPGSVPAWYGFKLVDTAGVIYSGGVCTNVTAANAAIQAVVTFVLKCNPAGGLAFIMCHFAGGGSSLHPFYDYTSIDIAPGSDPTICYYGNLVDDYAEFTYNPKTSNATLTCSPFFFQCSFTGGAAWRANSHYIGSPPAFYHPLTPIGTATTYTVTENP